MPIKIDFILKIVKLIICLNPQFEKYVTHNGRMDIRIPFLRGLFLCLTPSFDVSEVD